MNFFEKNKYVVSTSIILIVILLFLLVSQIITKNVAIPCVMITFVVLVYVFSIEDKKKKYTSFKVLSIYIQYHFL